MDDSLRQVLEYKLVYAIIVAGKSARFADGAMARLGERMVERYGNRLWLPCLRTAADNGDLLTSLQECRTGNYQKIRRAILCLTDRCPDLETCTAEELERVHGIGPKTSRFFLRWSGRRGRFAVLDVHILRWLQEQGHSVPGSTPQGKSAYARVEQIYLSEADRLGEHPCDLDQRLWLERNKSGIRV